MQVLSLNACNYINLLELLSTINSSHKLFIINFYNTCKTETEKLQVDIECVGSNTGFKRYQPGTFGENLIIMSMYI